MEPSIDTLPQAKHGELQGHHMNVLDFDRWSIPPVVHAVPPTQSSGGPGAISGSRPHCVGQYI